MAATTDALRVRFDREEDALYVSCGTPLCGHVQESREGLFLRHTSSGDPPNAVVAFGFEADWVSRLPQLCSAVAQYLGVLAEDVERAAQEALPAKTATSC
jgi:hypothetical protein